MEPHFEHHTSVTAELPAEPVEYILLQDLPQEERMALKSLGDKAAMYYTDEIMLHTVNERFAGNSTVQKRLTEMVGVNPKTCRGILGFYDMSSDEQNTLRVLATRLTKNQKVNYAELHDLKAIIRSVDFIALVIKEDSH